MRLKPFISACLMIFIGIGCSSKEPIPLQWLEIAGRGIQQTERQSLYRIKIPKEWKTTHPPLNDPLQDTTFPLSEFYIEENEESIRITIHNFPTDSFEERITPQAQIARWKRQFEQLDLSSVSIIPQAYSGFAGSLFDAVGIIQGKMTRVMAWSLQIGTDHYQTLSLFQNPYYKQMRADVTIKVVGSPNLMTLYHDKIIAFARSFELINEIPNRS